MYDAIICKEADTRLNVFVYVFDVQQEEYMPQNGAMWDTRCNICDVRQGSIKGLCKVKTIPKIQK